MHWLLIPLILLLSTDAVAHGGGLDRHGCHHNRKAGNYHCHQGPNAGQQYQSKQQILQPQADQLSGQARVTDGDTIRIGSTRIRLHGIDAPESKQRCTADGQEWQCGSEATEALRNMINGKDVVCSQRDKDRYGRIVAVCRVGATDINAWMVLNGWAVAYRRYSMDYMADEVEAKRGNRGLWRGQFMMPWEWRRR